MTARWNYPRRSDELAWPSVPYDPQREPVPLRVTITEFRCSHFPKRP